MATLRAKLRLAARALAILSGFLVLVPVHVAASVAGRPNAIPPVFLGYVGRMAGLRVRSHGHPRPGALFLANHESWLDILALAGTTRARFVAHSGLAGHPVLRWLCEQNGTVFVTRDRRGTVAEQVGQARYRHGPDDRFVAAVVCAALRTAGGVGHGGKCSRSGYGLPC